MDHRQRIQIFAAGTVKAPKRTVAISARFVPVWNGVRGPILMKGKTCGISADLSRSSAIRK